MLHDIGHGPFSHAFEEARKSIARQRDGKDAKIKKHEYFSAELVRAKNSQISKILLQVDVDPNEVADLIQAETPTDMYHAIISSSFDADRLDYLQRDKYMTGVGSGSIDLAWLLDNVRVAELDVSAVGGEDENPVFRHSFCLNYKARDAAEDFILSRYRLYSNVYFHKTTRGMEQLISAVFRGIALELDNGKGVQGLSPKHPLCIFLSKDGDTPSNLTQLDDVVVWGAIHELSKSGSKYLRDISLRILERRKPYCVDLQVTFPDDTERQRKLKHRFNEKFKAQIDHDVFRDSAKLSLYGAIGGDDDRAQKRVMIMLRNKELREITDSSAAILNVAERERLFERYYFLNDSDKKTSEGIIEEIRGRKQ